MSKEYFQPRKHQCRFTKINFNFELKCNIELFQLIQHN